MSDNDSAEGSLFNTEDHGNDPSFNESVKADASAGKPLNKLQEALKDKFRAEKTFIKGPQSKKAEAEATFVGGAQTRKTEADADKAETEAAFIKGVQTRKTGAEAEKFETEATFIKGAQTRKIDAEAEYLQVRRMEAAAEVERLKVERMRLEADAKRLEIERLRLKAETDFTEGPRTFRERMDGRASRSESVKNYAGIIGTILGLCLQVAILGGGLYFFFNYLR